MLATAASVKLLALSAWLAGCIALSGLLKLVERALILPLAVLADVAVVVTILTLSNFALCLRLRIPKLVLSLLSFDISFVFAFLSLSMSFAFAFAQLVEVRLRRLYLSGVHGSKLLAAGGENAVRVYR